MIKRKKYAFIVFILIVFLLFFVSCGKEKEETTWTKTSETEQTIDTLDQTSENEEAVAEETFGKSKFEIFLDENTEILVLDSVWDFEFCESTTWL